MSTRFAAAIALMCAGAGLLAACSGGTVGGTPSPATSNAPSSTSSAESSSASLANAPKVPMPLPATVLDGSPCNSALTMEQVVTFIGTPKAPQSDDTIPTGPACTWSNASGAGGQIGVNYETKIGGGWSAAYRNLKGNSDRWEPTTLQGYPAVAATNRGEDQSITGRCDVTVGIRDDLSFAVSLTLSNNARTRGVDSCEGAKDIADSVLTNLKGRA
ncbi:MAG TPA: DUF3558 domain-containing protein [Amycolatopsis sp.]|nr:DUF3558 domain-containing protein [Amycolatopsis sp.]